MALNLPRLAFHSVDFEVVDLEAVSVVFDLLLLVNQPATAELLTEAKVGPAMNTEASTKLRILRDTIYSSG